MSYLHRITLLLLCLVALMSVITPPTTYAASYAAVQSGNWNDTATWGGAIPGNFDNVSIPGGITVTIPNATTVTRKALTTVDGFLVNNGTLDNNAIGMEVNGTLDNNGILYSSANLYNRETLNNNSGATFTVYTNLYNWGTFNNAGTFTTAGSGGIGNGTPEHWGVMNNSGVVIVDGRFNNYRQLNNNGSITNNNTFINYCLGAISGNAVTGNPVYYQSMATAPTVESPAHRAHTTNTTPSFAWSSVTGAQSYRLMVYLGDRSFEYKKRVFTNNYTLDASEALPYPGKYLWRVRTQDQVCGLWSGWSGRSTLFID